MTGVSGWTLVKYRRYIVKRDKYRHQCRQVNQYVQNMLDNQDNLHTLYVVANVFAQATGFVPEVKVPRGLPVPNALPIADRHRYLVGRAESSRGQDAVHQPHHSPIDLQHAIYQHP
jgi:hypothetical protein